MEGWRQERLGSRAGTHREEEKNKKTSLQEEKEKKQKNTLDSYRPSHGRTNPAVEAGCFRLNDTSRILAALCKALCRL
jgi:hypothetical protein